MKLGMSMILTFLLGMTAVFWYSSYETTVLLIRAAIINDDMQALNTYINYPLLRENLHAQVRKEKIRYNMISLNQLFDPLRVVGVNRIINNDIQPENIKANIQRITQFGTKLIDIPVCNARDKPCYMVDHINPNTVMIYVILGSNRELATLVLSRSGYATWKITDIRNFVISYGING